MTVSPRLIPTELWDYSVADVIHGLSGALAGRTVQETLTIPDVGEAVTVRSGRAGILLALKALDLKRGAVVGVPLYCCPVVFKAIVAAGCEPRFLDVDPATQCMSVEDLSAKEAELDALVAVHMFGHVCDIAMLRAVMPDRPIVEDCAQSIGSTLHGRATGALGDVAVFSFRSGKYVSVGEGGAVAAPTTHRIRRLQQLMSALPPVTRQQECEHVGKSYVRSTLRSRPLYGLVGHAVWEAYNRAVTYASKSPLVIGRAFGSDISLTLARLPALASAIETRRDHARRYARALEGCEVTLSPEPADARWNGYQWPMLFASSAIRDGVARYLLARSIDSSKPYRDIAEVAAAHYGYSGDCPESEYVADRVLVVPNHERLRSKDVERIAREIVNALRASATPAPTARNIRHESSPRLNSSPRPL